MLSQKSGWPPPPAYLESIALCLSKKWGKRRFQSQVNLPQIAPHFFKIYLIVQFGYFLDKNWVHFGPTDFQPCQRTIFWYHSLGGEIDLSNNGSHQVSFVPLHHQVWSLTINIFSSICKKSCVVIFYRKRLNKMEMSFCVSTTTPSWDRRHGGPNVDVAWPQPDFLFGFPECRLNDRLFAVTSATREANLTSMRPENKKIQLLWEYSVLSLFKYKSRSKV